MPQAVKPRLRYNPKRGWYAAYYQVLGEWGKCSYWFAGPFASAEDACGWAWDYPGRVF